MRPQIDSRAFHIKEWLRGGKFFREEEGALTLIPLEAVWIKPIMVVVRLTMETKIPPLILFFLIGIALIILAAKIGHLLGPGITFFFYAVGGIITLSIPSAFIKELF